MAKPLEPLRERLLRAGVAPQHVRRYLTELTDHLADLQAEERRAGRSEADAASAALHRLGTVEDLARPIIAQPQLHSWLARAPWAAFSMAPLVVLAVSWLVALLLLRAGWSVFKPGAETPFGGGPHTGVENLYFQIDRAFYFTAPVLVGWGVALTAIRLRCNVLWPGVGLALLALAAGTARVEASRKTLPHAIGNIQIHFTFGPSVETVTGCLIHGLIILCCTVTPYFLWSWHRAHKVMNPD